LEESLEACGFLKQGCSGQQKQTAGVHPEAPKRRVFGRVSSLSQSMCFVDDDECRAFVAERDEFVKPSECAGGPELGQDPKLRFQLLLPLTQQWRRNQDQH
jgi:hypothetical protein